jgi:membrane protein implicated in regulation of membrane protease activity
LEKGGISPVRIVVYGLLAVMAGFFLMYPLAAIFDAYGWPYFNGWALAHGSLLLAWPMLTVVSFVVLVLVDRLLRREKSSFLSIAPPKTD